LPDFFARCGFAATRLVGSPCRSLPRAGIAGKSNENLPLGRQTQETPPETKKKAELSLGQVQQGGMRYEKKLNRISTPI
jgi:hypothetical protein